MTARTSTAGEASPAGRSNRVGLRNHADECGGPVPLESAKPDGVGDFVVRHADHSTLCQPDGAKPPVAWETVRDRG